MLNLHYSLLLNMWFCTPKTQFKSVPENVLVYMTDRFERWLACFIYLYIYCSVKHRTSSRDETLEVTMLRMLLSWRFYCNLLMMSSSSLDEELTVKTLLDLGRSGERLKVKEICLFRRILAITGWPHWGSKKSEQVLIKPDDSGPEKWWRTTNTNQMKKTNYVILVPPVLVQPLKQGINKKNLVFWEKKMFPAQNLLCNQSTEARNWK